MSKLLHAEVCHFRLVNTMRIPEYFLTPFSFWAHPSCHNVLNCHFILFGGASWVSWVLYGIMGIMDRPQVVHRKHPLAPNDDDLLGYRSIRSIHGMEKLPLCTVVTLRRFRLDFGRENMRKPWAFSSRRTHLWSFRVQRFRVFRTWIPLKGDGGDDDIFLCRARQRPKQWMQTLQRNGGLSFFPCV